MLGAQWQRICLQCWTSEFNSWVGKVLWRREWQPTPVFLPGKSHGQRNLAVYSPRDCIESDTTERLSMHTDDSLGLSNVRVITAKLVLGLFLILNTSLKSQSFRLEKKYRFLWNLFIPNFKVSWYKLVIPNLIIKNNHLEDLSQCIFQGLTCQVLIQHVHSDAYARTF